MKDDLEQLLKNLRLGRMAEILDQELGEAAKEQPSYEEFLARLLRAQWHNRQESALAYRIRQARLPESWTLESFPYKKQPEVNQRQIRSFGELDFIAKAENLVFIGPTGVGKTGLASGILLKALQNGHRGLFIRAQDLFDEMYASLADRSSRQLINKLISPAASANRQRVACGRNVDGEDAGHKGLGVVAQPLAGQAPVGLPDLEKPGAVFEVRFNVPSA